MKASRPLLSGLAVLSLVAVSACATDPNTGQKRISRTAIGAGIGAVSGLFLGSLVGGSGAEILGAGIGGVAGAAVGAGNDKRGSRPREQTTGSGVEVQPPDQSGGPRR